MKVNKLYLIFGLLVCFQNLFAQSYIVVRKKGAARRYEYRIGDYLIYKQEGHNLFFKDRITGFADSTIVLENNIVHTSQITAVNISNASTNRPPILRKMEFILPVIGFGLLGIDILNNSLVEGNRFTLDKGVTTTSATLILTGYGLKWMRRKKIDLTNPNFELYIVEF